MELFIDILKDTTIDTVKLIPFLFLTYLAMEYLENKAGQKTVRMLLGAGKKGPVIGGILGVVPQCGFSAAAANLYSGGVITVGTMIAVFLSTSDEMLPILISEQADVRKIMAILIGKIIVGIVAGILVEYRVRVLANEYQRGLHIHDICERPLSLRRGKHCKISAHPFGTDSGIYICNFFCVKCYCGVDWNGTGHERGDSLSDCRNFSGWSCRPDPELRSFYCNYEILS